MHRRQICGRVTAVRFGLLNALKQYFFFLHLLVCPPACHGNWAGDYFAMFGSSYIGFSNATLVCAACLAESPFFSLRQHAQTTTIQSVISTTARTTTASPKTASGTTPSSSVDASVTAAALGHTPM